MKKLIPGFLAALVCLVSHPVKAQQSIWTQHNDQARTGWYPFETTLNTANVNTNNFGFLYSQIVDDKFFAQPLIVMKLNMPGKGIKNVVFVATVNNTIYAFDADANTPAFWQKNYTNTLAAGTPDCTNCRPPYYTDVHPSLCGGYYGDFKGNMGIVGTPVIDTANATMYFVSKIVNQNDGPIDNHPYNYGVKDEYNYTKTGFHQYLHAIDITTGNDRPNSPVEITATVNGTGDGQTSPGRISFDSRRQFNRAGLALANGNIYIAFGANCDVNPSHGWVISYNAASLAFVNAYNATPNDGRGGIWMAGTAPAIDASGNLYITTGNSLNEDRTTNEYNTFNASPSIAANRGEGVVKLAPDLSISSYFTPYNYVALNDADLDFPTQVMLIPNTSLALTAAKDGNIYVMNQSGLGGFNTSSNNVLQTVNNGGYFHSSFAYFNGGANQYFYTFSENAPFKSYPVSAGGLGTATSNFSVPQASGESGAYLSVSSNGPDNASAIVWAYRAVNGCDGSLSSCRGVLHAFSATNINNELWNSDMVTPDKLNYFNKMTCPTIALGKVFIPGNTNQLVVYGLKATSACQNNVALGRTATALTSQAGYPASNVLDGNTGTRWQSNPQDVDSIYIDLGSSFDICKIIINWDPSGYGQDYDLKISSDGVNWSTVNSVRGNSATYNEYNGAVTARFINMRGIVRGTANGYSITEFQVFGTPSNNSCQAPTGLSATATGSTTTIFTNQVPTVGTDNDGQGFNAGLKFRSTTAGNILGLRFYKTTGNSGTHVGALYDPANGALLSSVTYTNETSTGWQTAVFSSPVAITANKTYTAVYFSASGNYTESNNYFANAGITNGPLTALKDGVDGCNGPYDYSSALRRPQSCYLSANYWVDVLFSGGSATNSELLQWTAVPGATQYLIQYRPNLSASWISRTTSNNFITVSALTCGAQYLYTVQTVCNGVNGGITQSGFTAPACTGGPTCDLLPTRYFSVDLGDIGVAGSTCRNGTAYTINGSGLDIGGNSDQFQFVYTNGNDAGDYDVVGRVTSQTVANTNSKAGIMVRDSVSNTSRFAYVAVSGSKIIFEYRDQPGAAATKITAAGTFTLPYYLKISKSGTVFSAFISPNGTTWTSIGSHDMNFGNDNVNTPHYGMAVTSADNTKLATGVIDNFAIVVANSNPVVANAGNNQTITLPTSSVTLDGSASTGTITSYAWTQVSGPGTATIANPSGVSTGVSGLVQGVYVFELSVNNGASVSQVSITVNPAVSAGISIFTTQIPVSSTSNDRQSKAGQEVGLRFRSSSPGFITGIRFYKTTGNTGTHIGELYSNGGTRLAQATFTNETATGWQTVMFANQVAINANTTYVAAYFSAAGNYVEDNGYFASTGVTNGNLTALKDGTDGCNGPYLYSAAPAFPTKCYKSANYWVDVIYSGNTSTVVANAGSNQTITLPTSGVTLDGSASTGTITSYAWTKVSGPNNPTIVTPAAVSTSVTGLIQGTYVFQLSLNGGVSTAQVTITVNAAAGPGLSIFTTQTPVSTTDNDHKATVGQEVGMRFRSSIAGFITGIRFYKTSGNTGTHIGELYSNTGTRLAQATFSGETATGWQTVNFSTAVAINANTTYVAAYFSSQGYYVEDNLYFQNAGVTNGTLTALKDGVDGCNGPYAYTASPAFPNQCYLSANYWVDPIFSTSSTGTGSVTNGPILQSLSPDSAGTLTPSYFLGQNYPNPANRTTRIDFSIPRDGRVQLILLDVMGRRLNVMVDGPVSAGRHTFELNTSTLGKGVYFYQMTSGSFKEVKRMVVQ